MARRLLASAQSSQCLRSARRIAIANPLRYQRFFGRYLSNAALMDLRVGAVPFHTDLGLDRRSVSTDLLKNITIICLRRSLVLQPPVLSGVNSALSSSVGLTQRVICRAIGKPLVCSRSFALPSVSSVRSNLHSPLRKVGPSYAKLSELVANRSEERRVGKECRSRWSPY